MNTSSMGKVAVPSSRAGYLLVAGLVVIPIILWATTGSLASRFSSPLTAALSFGQLLGITGLSLFGTNLILSARIRLVESFFGGLDKMFIAHHLVGGMAFIILLFHPIFVTLPALQVSLRNALEFMVPGFDNLPVMLGVLALLLLSTCLIITFYFFKSLAYQRWKLIHQLLGVAFLLGGLHGLLTGSDLLFPGPLRYYMLGFVAVSLGCYLYRTVLGYWLVRRISVTVEKIRLEKAGVTEITLKPAKPFSFLPGQFVFVSFSDPVVGGEWHPFSLSSRPGDAFLTISAKALGDFTKRLPNLTAGSAAKLEGPYGRFSYACYPQDKPHIWVAGGIGITPFLSMLRSLTPDSPLQVDFYYSTRSKEEASYLDEIVELAGKLPKLRLFPILADVDGFLTMQRIAEQSSHLAASEIFLCGPPPMVKALLVQGKELGLARQQFHYERFALQE